MGSWRPEGSVCAMLCLSMTENPGVLLEWHQMAGGNSGESQKEKERGAEGQWLPISHPNSEEHPAAWSHPRS